MISYGLSPSLSPDYEEQVALVKELILAMPRQHRAFLERLRLTYTCGDFFFVHAGVRPGFPLQISRKLTCCGSAKSFSRARRISANISCTATRRSAAPKCWRTAPISIPGPMRPEISHCYRFRAAACSPSDRAMALGQWLGLAGLWSGNRLSIAAFRNLKWVIDVASSLRRRCPLAISVLNRS